MRVSRHNFFVLTLHLVTLSVLLILSLRNFLFGSGFTPPMTYLTGFSHEIAVEANFPLSYNFLYGYANSTTWIFELPWTLVYLLVHNIIIAMKLLLVLVYIAYYTISYLTAKLFYDTFRIKNVGFQPFSVIFIIFMFLSYFFTYGITAPYLPFLFGVPLFVYVLLKYHRIVVGSDSTIKDRLKLAFSVMYMGLGDPRMYILALLGLFAATLFQPSKSQLIRAIKTLLTLLLVSVPYIVFVYKVYTFGLSAIYISPRPFSYSQVNYWTKTYPLLTFFDFRALPWPASVSSSIGILGTSHIQTLPTLGRIPSILLSRNTLLDNFWFLSTMTPFALFAIPAVLKRFKSVSYHYVGALFIFSVALGTYLPITPLLHFFLWLGHLPIVGGVWAITYAIPNYLLESFASYCLFFDLLTILVLYETIFKKAGGTNNKKVNIKRTIALTVVVSLIMISNWQFFDGSFYPGQYTPGQYTYILGNNGVAPLGAYQPTNPPQFWQQLYQKLSAPKGANYAVAWLQPYGFAYKWSPRVTGFYDPGISPPDSFYQYLSQIISNGATYLTKTIMDIYGVRYIVVDNTSLSPLTPFDPSITINQLYQFLNASPGVVLAASYPNQVYVFEDPNATLFEFGGPSLYYRGSDTLDTAYYLDRILGHVPPIFNKSSPSEAWLLIGSQSLSNNSVDLIPPWGLVTPNVSILNATKQFTLEPSQGVVELSHNWFIETLGKPFTAHINLSAMNLKESTKEQGLVSLSYGFYLIPGAIAIPIPPNYSVYVTWSFDYKTSGNTNLSTSLWVNNQNYKEYGGFLYFSKNLPFSNNWRSANFTANLPAGYTTFEIQINAQLQGSVELKDIKVEYAYYQNFVKPRQVEIRVDSPSNYTLALLIKGDGDLLVNNKTVTVYATNPKVFYLTLFSKSYITINTKNVNMSEVLIAPTNLLKYDANDCQTGGYKHILESVPVKCSNESILVTSLAGFSIERGDYLGRTSFGQEAYLIYAGANSLYVKQGLLYNIAEIAFSLIFYTAILIFFLKKPKVKVFQTARKNFFPD